MRPTMQRRPCKQKLRQLEPYIGRWETHLAHLSVNDLLGCEVSFVADQQLVHMLVRVAIDF
jgi:hypothetical protein